MQEKFKMLVLGQGLRGVGPVFPAMAILLTAIIMKAGRKYLKFVNHIYTFFCMRTYFFYQDKKTTSVNGALTLWPER